MIRILPSEEHEEAGESESWRVGATGPQGLRSVRWRCYRLNLGLDPRADVVGAVTSETLERACDRLHPRCRYPVARGPRLCAVGPLVDAQDGAPDRPSTLATGLAAMVVVPAQRRRAARGHSWPGQRTNELLDVRRPWTRHHVGSSRSCHGKAPSQARGWLSKARLTHVMLGPTLPVLSTGSYDAVPGPCDTQTSCACK